MPTEPRPPIILASGSPRRRDLLAADGFSVEVLPPDLDETARPGETPDALVERLAREKAAAIAVDREGIVVAGDTVVVLDDSILGKPTDDADATQMLRALSGRTHTVLGGWCVRRGTQVLSGVERTEVRFRSLSESEIAAYVATGEPHDKAGAYGIQERGGAFVRAVTGSYDNVVGLPLATVRSAIHAVTGRAEEGPAGP